MVVIRSPHVTIVLQPIVVLWIVGILKAVESHANFERGIFGFTRRSSGGFLRSEFKCSTGKLPCMERQHSNCAANLRSLSDRNGQRLGSVFTGSTNAERRSKVQASKEESINGFTFRLPLQLVPLPPKHHRDPRSRPDW